jgi:hypothetical protein
MKRTKNDKKTTKKDQETTKKFICIECNYYTNDKPNFMRHKKTQKHVKKTGKIIEQSDVIPKQHDCNFCDAIFKSKYSIKRHLLSCKVKSLTDILTEKNKYIHTLELKIAKYEGNMETYEKEREHQKTTMDFIKECFKNAPLLKDYDFNIPQIELYKATRMGCIDGGVHLIRHALIENVDPKDRSVWCLDYSRGKYVYKNSDGWVLDPDGINIQNVTMQEICKQLNKYINNKFNEASKADLTDDIAEEMKLLTTFNVDIQNKKMAHKIFRKAAKQFVFVYEKECYNQQEIEDKIHELES